MDVLDTLEKVAVSSTDKPLIPVKMLNVKVFSDPFEAYNKKLADKLANEEKNKKRDQDKIAEKKRKELEERKRKKLNEDPEKGNTIGKYLSETTATSGTSIIKDDSIEYEERVYKKMKNESKSKSFGNFDNW